MGSSSDVVLLRSHRCKQPPRFLSFLWPKHPPLLFPQERDAFTEITQTKFGILSPFKDRFHDIGCKLGQLKESADVASVDLIISSDVFEIPVLTGLELVLPPIRFSQRRDQRHVEGFVLRLFIAGLVVFGQDHLPTVEPSATSPERRTL